ncbi:MAG TPA: DUF2807 domain-containing protein [Paludibacteraceae bacterium]|nr:DUF2807 domain-containing protein [Paludibacteraceae bacterium]
MKNLLLISILFINAIIMQSQVVTETRIETSDDILVIQIDGLPNICIRNGNIYKVEVEAEKKNQSHIKTSVKDKKIPIISRKFFESSHYIVYITIPNKSIHIKANDVANIYIDKNTTLQIDTISLSANAVANIYLDKIITNTLNCKLNSVANITIKGSANKCNLNFKSVANTKLNEFKIKDTNLLLKDVANFELNTTENNDDFDIKK